MIAEKNLGLGPARNTGIKNSRGKYVYFVDSDDFILPNALEKFYNAAEKFNAQVVHASAWHELWQDEVSSVYENLRFQKDYSYAQEGFLTNNLMTRLEAMNITFPTAWLCFCRRDFLLENHIEFLPVISEDNAFSFALLRYAKRYYILRHAPYIYRRRTGSIMTSNSVDRLSKGIDAIITGSIYVGKLLDDLPRSEGYDQWRERVLAIFSTNLLRVHTNFFYKDLKLSAEANAAAEKILTAFFGNKMPFVKFLFNGFHIFRIQALNLLQQNQRLNALPAFLVRDRQNMLRIMESIRANDKRIFLAGTPMHGNLGDQAIVLGELTVLKNYFPDYEIIDLPYDYLTGDFGEFFWGLGWDKLVKQNDIIFLFGGGNLGNLWLNEEQLSRKLIEKFPDNKIVIFPQSVYFTADDNGRRELELSAKIYNAHNDLHLMLRDENSFNLAQKIFPDVHKYLLPDAATSLQGILDDVKAEREGVLFILRSDKEKDRDDKIIEMLQTTFLNANIPFEVIDTVIDERVTTLDRESKVRAVLTKIRKSKLVITDRFHGVIFSFITRTPVIAFKSFDTKISSGIKWFKNVPSIFYAEERGTAGIKNFINRALKSGTSFAEMNPNLKFNSEEIFITALKKIVGKPEVKPVNPPALHLPDVIDNRKVVFVNFMGRGYGCNPKYIAKEILRQNLPLDLVWLVKDLNEPMPAGIRKVLYGSVDSVYELATAKVIVTNTKNLLPFPNKRQGQYFIMTWHSGIAFKAVEGDAEDKLSPAYVKQSKINSAITDLMLVESQEQFEEFKRAFWYNGEILKCGLPRNDIFFNRTEKFIAGIKKSLNVPANRKIVMYAPTFRDNPAILANIYKLDAKRLAEVLKKKFGGKWLFLIRLHPNVAWVNLTDDLFGDAQNIINVSTYPDMQELLVVADILISDYSSVIYDSMILHNPTFIFAKDFDSYPKERGFKQLYFDLPFKINRTEEELFNCIETFDAAALEPKIKHFLNMVKPFDNGHASEEVVKKIKTVVGEPEVNLVNRSTRPFTGRG